MKTNEIVTTITTIEVRKHNGQCAHGEWMRLAEHPELFHVFSAAADEAAETGLAAGRVDIGGQLWLYRR